MVHQWAGWVLKGVSQWEKEGEEDGAPPGPSTLGGGSLWTLRNRWDIRVRGVSPRPFHVLLVCGPSSKCSEAICYLKVLIVREQMGKKIEETEQRNFLEITQESNRDKIWAKVFHPFYLCLTWHIPSPIPSTQASPEVWWCKNQTVAFIVLNSWNNEVQSCSLLLTAPCLVNMLSHSPHGES